MIPSCRPPSATTGRWRPAVTPRSRPSRPTWPKRPPRRRSPTPFVAWPPTAASASSVPCRWPPRSATGDASPTQPGSWPSPGWSPASVPPATASGAATSPAPAASTCASNWWSRPGPIITAPHRRRPPPAPTAGGRRHPGPLLGGPAGPVPPLPAAGTPQAHHRRGRGRRRPGACRVPVGRDARLRLYAADPGAVADRRARTRQPQDPSEHRRRRQDPRDLTATPKTARRIKSGATACAQPTCGPDPRTSEWRSADPRRSDAVLANLRPATPRRPPHPPDTRSCSPAAPHLTAPFHISPYVLRGRPFLDENRGWLPADAGSP